MDVPQARKLKVLEEENRRLKRLLANTMLDNAMPKEGCVKKLVKLSAQRNSVKYTRKSGIRERRACTIFVVDRTSVRYELRRNDDRDLSNTYRRNVGQLTAAFEEDPLNRHSNDCADLSRRWY